MTEPLMPQQKPYVLNVDKSGKVAWCACGRSQNQPYCDGSHKVTEIRPIVVEVEEGKTVAWCGCKRSGSKPFCDGTHSRL